MKGIIVAAGYGTRFLPVTKTLPKEMLPLINVPSIQFIVDEFINAGISEIVIISSRRKKVLEDYFDREIELESIFLQEGKKAQLESIAPSKANIAFIRQSTMLGTGHALLQAKSWLGKSPAIVAYPDDLHFGEIPLAKQLIDVYKKTKCSVMASISVDGDVSRYGVLEIAKDNLHVKSIVEKPEKGTEPSKEVSIGRFLFNYEFFEYLEEGWNKHCLEAEQNNKNLGEYYHIYALNKLMEQNKVVYTRTKGDRLDTGDTKGFLEAILRYADMDKDLSLVIDNYIKKRNKK